MSGETHGAAEIAGRLTEAERRTVMMSGAHLRGLSHIKPRIVECEWSPFGGAWRWFHTPLGHAVRAEIEKEAGR